MEFIANGALEQHEKGRKKERSSVSVKMPLLTQQKHPIDTRAHTWKRCLPAVYNPDCSPAGRKPGHHPEPAAPRRAPGVGARAEVPSTCC